MLEVVGISKKYDKASAVEDVSFTLPEGTIGILQGPDGAGKSTVLKSIAGLVRYQGQIRIQGMDAGELEAKKRFAYVPEVPSLYEALTVKEHLEFMEMAYGVQADPEEKLALLKRFGLDDKQDRMANDLPKDMMQKVSICCSLIVKPQLLLLDEPMAGLEPAAIKELQQIILELKQKGTTVLICTGMPEMVQELWDITFVMDNGRLLETYSREAEED